MPPDGNMFIEKRVHPRVTLKIPLKYSVIQDQSEIESIREHKINEVTAHTFNMSLGGLYLVADHLIAVGSVVRLDFNIPEIPHLISAYAEVVWANERGAGLHFEAMKDEDLGDIKEYLSHKTH